MTQTQAYLLTLAIEVPIAVGLAAWRRLAPGRLRRVALAGVAASSLTHPLLWLVDPLLWDTFDTPARWGLLEAAITLVEGAVYSLALGWRARTGLLVSLIANAVSFGVGVVIYATA